MAGDWIKMRGNLWDDPRVSRLVDMTDSSEAAVIGALYWLWAAADQHTEDGFMPGLSLRQIDRKTGIKGIGDALVSIGWLTESDDGVTIPNFDEHNGESAKKRCQTAKRVAKHKTANAEVSEKYDSANAEVTAKDESANAHSVTFALAERYLEKEKRREEKNNTSEAKASGAVSARPPRVTDPDEIIFGYGVPLLVSAGSEEKHARSFLGKLRKDHGDTRVVDALRECVKTKPLQPLEWLAGALPPKGKSAMNRQEAIEADGKRVAAEWLAEQGGVA